MIMEDLKVLPPDKLDEARDLIHQLTEKTLTERKANLMNSAGCLTKEEADELERIIEEGCEKIDERDW